MPNASGSSATFTSTLPFAERGVGKRLVGAAIDFANETASRAILVELPFSEPHLTRFYTHLGFDKDAVFELYRFVVK